MLLRQRSEKKMYGLDFFVCILFGRFTKIGPKISFPPFRFFFKSSKNLKVGVFCQVVLGCLKNKPFFCPTHFYCNYHRHQDTLEYTGELRYLELGYVKFIQNLAFFEKSILIKNAFSNQIMVVGILL